MWIRLFKRCVCWITLAAFMASGVTPLYARGIVTALDLPRPGTMVHVSSSFVPPILKGINVNVKEPFKFDFLIRYFLASLTVPEKNL